MKMNGQSRTFVKQVKLDLLALSDADLFQIMQQWVEGSDLNEKSPDLAEENWFALGYSRVLADARTQADLSFNVLEAECETPKAWIAPTPQQLRTILSAMDEQQFAQYVITLAYQSLHLVYPEWYDGLTFNAHLANYLRQINMKRRTMSIKQSI